MNGWRETTLKKEVDLITGFPFKSASYIDNESGIKLLRGDNIVQGKLRWDGVKRWPADDESVKPVYQLREGDIVLAMDRPWIEAGLKYAAISQFDLPCFLVQRVACIRGKETLLSSFLRYLIGGKDFTQHILSVETGTAVPHISGAQIQEYAFLCPPLAEQKAIASVLSSLDDKIDLLNRQNKTLEAMAETLFRQWFVEEAREDWEARRLSDYAAHVKVNVTPSESAAKLYTHYSLPLFDEGMRPAVELGAAILSNKYAVEPWTILVSKLNPRFPRIWAIGADPGQNAVCSTEFQVLRPKKNKLYGFLYYFLKSKDSIDELSMAASGTSGSHQRVKPADIFNLEVRIPSEAIAEKYSELVLPNIEKLMVNVQHVYALEKLRDTLLPKLMSGEIRVAI